MLIPEQKFDDYDAWVACAQGRGYSGPHQQQGWRVYQFTDWRGVMAVWDNDAGAVFADTAPDPVDLTEPADVLQEG